jgi:hypothetical protein
MVLYPKNTRAIQKQQVQSAGGQFKFIHNKLGDAVGRPSVVLSSNVDVTDAKIIKGFEGHSTKIAAVEHSSKETKYTFDIGKSEITKTSSNGGAAENM